MQNWQGDNYFIFRYLENHLNILVNNVEKMFIWKNLLKSMAKFKSKHM